VPVGGPAGFYEMTQTATTSSKYNTYQFNPGYNTMNFYADQVGRHALYFVVNNQPSNVVVVDVFAQDPAGSTKPVHTMLPYFGPTSAYAGPGNGAKPGQENKNYPLAKRLAKRLSFLGLSATSASSMPSNDLALSCDLQTYGGSSPV